MTARKPFCGAPMIRQSLTNWLRQSFKRIALYRVTGIPKAFKKMPNPVMTMDGSPFLGLFSKAQGSHALHEASRAKTCFGPVEIVFCRACVSIQST